MAAPSREDTWPLTALVRLSASPAVKLSLKSSSKSGACTLDRVPEHDKSFKDLVCPMKYALRAERAAKISETKNWSLRSNEWALAFHGAPEGANHRYLNCYPQRPQQHCWLLTGRVPPSLHSSFCSAPSQGQGSPRCHYHASTFPQSYTHHQFQNQNSY